MQHRNMGKLIGEFFHKVAPIATIILLYISIYYANVDKLNY